MCLYDGLDSYAIAWLQFFYPLCLWLIAVALIVSSHYSTRVSKLTGRNAVQVLATMFLISYTRLLRLVIDVISYTKITYPDGYKKTVWLVNGNIEFLTGKHIPLFLVTVLFVLLSLPYTFILLTIQFLYKLSHYRVVVWVQRLKPFFDAYTGPYKPHHRYWTGLLLVARIVLLVTFSANQSSNISVNLLAIIIVTFAPMGWFSFTKWIYESSLNNFLEITFLCNLGITSAAVLFDTQTRSNRTAVYSSTSIALVLFVGIILYHAQRQLLLTKLGSKLERRMLKVFVLKEGHEGSTNENVRQMLSSSQGQRGVTSTVVELKEPLLDDELELS